MKKPVKQKNSNEKKFEWRSIFNNLSDAITIHDKDFNVIKANKAAVKLLNLSNPNKQDDKKCFRHYHGSNSPPEGCPSCSCLKTGKPVSSDLFEPYLNKHIEIRAIPRLDNHKQIVGVIHIVRDITKRKKMEQKLSERTTELEETNIALKVLLRQNDKDKEALEEQILLNIKKLVNPYIQKMKKNKLHSKDLSYLRILESNLEEIISPFSKKLTLTHIGLTLKEVEIADLIKDSMVDKDIAELIGISLSTVKAHRRNIRRKLGITNQKINLNAHLTTFSR